MRIAQDRNFVVIAIVSAFVAATGWWGPVGRVSHAALPRFKNESAKTSEPLMSWVLAAADEPGRLPQPESQLTSLSLGGGLKLSSTLTGATVQFSAANYSVGEGDQRVTLSVTRSGDTSGPATVALATSDLAGAQNCNAITGLASSRCDYETSIGAVKFAAGETSKSVSVAIIDDAYLEGPETFTVSLTNQSGATLGSPANATVTIADNDVANGVSPIVTPSFFVPIHYLDFLNREPDPSGLNFWLNQITSCGADPQCTEVKRINVSASFYLSIEFQQTGYLVERLYKAAYGDATGASTYQGAHQLLVPIVRLNEFLSDTQEIGQGVIVNQGNWQQQLEDNKQSFSSEFVQRLRFTAAFPTSLTPAQYVDKLNTNAGNPLSSAERNQLVNDLTTSAKTRAQVLRTIAEHQNIVNAEFNRAFVLMQYFGYLRRNPDDPQDTDYTGYDFWLTKLNEFNGNFINAEMVKAFIASAEYGNRFGAAAPTPPPPSLTPEQRLAALEAVKLEFESLRSNPDRNAVNQGLLDFIRSRSEFAAAGISVDSCVWARYTDGVDLIVINNRQPPVGPPVQARPDSSSAAPAPEDIPDSNKARLVFALGGTFFNAASDIRTWLNAENYTQAINEGPTVDQLLNVGGDGVFYFDGHGGTGFDGAYTVVTATEPTALLDEKYKDDIQPDASGQVRLTYALIPDNFVGVFAQKKYAFGGNFIRKHWKNKFLPNSFFYNAACSGASASAADFEAALKEAGVSVYAGWTNEIGNLEGYRTARFVFDRLLGANQVNAESDGFKQRPFDYHAVADDLKLHSLGKDSGTGAELVFVQLSDGFKLLAPGIWLMDSVDEYLNELSIIGNFGKDPGNRGAVFVGGQQCHINSWTDTSIHCDLPVSGDGSSGEVLVTIGQQKSNAATLTEWEGDFTHTVNGLGTLKQTVVYHVRFRADIRKARTGIHQPPTILPRTFSATENSVLFYQNSGFYTAPPAPNGQSCTETWSGSSSFQRGLRFFDRTFALLGTFNDDRKLTAQLSVSSMSGRLSDTDCTNPTSHNQTNLALLSPKFGNLQDTFTIVLDSSFNIVGDTKTFIDASGNLHTMKWGNMQAKFPPKSDSPR